MNYSFLKSSSHYLNKILYHFYQKYQTLLINYPKTSHMKYLCHRYCRLEYQFRVWGVKMY
nr:MAG TPA: hypothetical protein [Crassvirales sp.]